MRIIIIGAGRVGCGALGLALTLQGHQVTFAARRGDLIASINKYGYLVSIKGSIESLVEVRGVRAVDVTGPEFIREVLEADQIFTAVRPDNLPAIALILSEAILSRIRYKVNAPLDVFCCENLKNSGAQLERLVFTNIPYQYMQQVQDRVGFHAAISDRIVSGQQVDAEGRFVFTTDAAGDVLFDNKHLRRGFDILPPFKGLDNFPASMEEKLYILNCGHAVCAYLGYKKGYKYIHDAMADEEINHCVVGAMLEAQKALHFKYGRALHYAGLINEILAAFSNPMLMDTVARVGRDPLRKLQPDDRLIGPAKLAYRYGMSIKYIIRGAAAALTFYDPEDSQSVELHKAMSEQGIEQTLDTISQLRPWNPISKLIKEEFERSMAGGHAYTRQL